MHPDRPPRRTCLLRLPGRFLRVVFGAGVLGEFRRRSLTRGLGRPLFGLEWDLPGFGGVRTARRLRINGIL